MIIDYGGHTASGEPFNASIDLDIDHKKIGDLINSSEPENQEMLRQVIDLYELADHDSNEPAFWNPCGKLKFYNREFILVFVSQDRASFALLEKKISGGLKLNENWSIKFDSEICHRKAFELPFAKGMYFFDYVFAYYRAKEDETLNHLTLNEFHSVENLTERLTYEFLLDY